jgi:ABC-type glycerol-3-phosphate transport system permease component
LCRIDPSLERAGSVTGIRQLTIFRRVTLPLVWPGILGGLIYVFTTAVSIFEIPAPLGAASGAKLLPFPAGKIETPLASLSATEQRDRLVMGFREGSHVTAA